MRTLVLITTLALAATGAVAQETDAVEEPTAEALIALIEENGCTMTDAEAETLLPPHGFTKENTSPLVDKMIADGTAVLEGDSLTVKTEACP